MAPRATCALLLAICFLVASVWPAAAGGPALPWRVVCVECPRMAEWPSEFVAVDAAGNPHFAYGGDHLYYARYDGRRLLTEVADGASGVGAHAQLVLDAAGRPHILHSEGAQYDYTAYYTRRVNGLWRSDRMGMHVGMMRLAVSPSGIAHIVYGVFPQLHYVRIDGVSMEMDTIPLTSPVFGFALALDAEGMPHVAYDSSKGVMVSTRTAGGWLARAVGAQGDARPTSLAFDGLGNLHMTTYDVQYGFLAHGSDKWQFERVAVGEDATLTLDAYGAPHVRFFILDMSQEPYRQLRYAARTSSGWGIYAHPTLAHYEVRMVDYQTDLQHFLTPPESRGTLELRYWSGEEWQTRAVEPVGRVGYDPSLVLDAAGRPYIATTGVTYYHLDGSAWQRMQVDQGRGPSLALDPAGQLYLTYGGFADAGLRHARQAGSGWQTETISQQWMPYHTGLAFDAEGAPHVLASYWGYGSHGSTYVGGPVYLSREGAGWAARFTGSLHTGRADMALNAAGTPDLVYAKEGELHFVRGGAAWQDEVIASNARDPSIAIDAADHPHVAYVEAEYVETEGAALRYLRWDGAAWQASLVLRGAAWPELALDATGAPHIAYLNTTINAQSFLRLLPFGLWVDQIVDWKGGGRSSLVFDAAGEPYLAYHDQLNGDLKLATRRFLDETRRYLPLLLSGVLWN